MVYEIKDFGKLVGVSGLSKELLENHFKLYQGYVNNTNKVLEILNNLLKENKTSTPEYAELKRRFGWEFNGMRLHELYFENMTKNSSLDKKSNLFKKLSEQFGSYENWEKDFKASASIRGIGWVILYYDFKEKKLFNCWINEHDTGHLSTNIPLLILDVFEHAYMNDYGIKKADYIESFFKIIDWNIINKRFYIGGEKK